MQDTRLEEDLNYKVDNFGICLLAALPQLLSMSYPPVGEWLREAAAIF